MSKTRRIIFHSDIRFAHVVVIMICALFLFACATAEIKKDIQAFSESVAITTTNTNAAFDMVEKNYYQAKVAQLATNYDEKGFRPDTIMRFLPPEEYNIRVQALQVLETYASKLSEIMSDDKLTEFDSQTKSFGEGLLKLRDNEALNRFLPTETDFNAFTTSVDTVGHWFIQYKREKGLKEIAQEMDGSIQNICRLLIADIGALPDSTGKGGHGLRIQLYNQYEELLEAQDTFIQHNLNKLDPRSKREEIAQLPQLLRDRETADATLAATQNAIKILGETHTELVKSFDAPTPKLKMLIRLLGEEGKRIGQFYRTLGK